MLSRRPAGKHPNVSKLTISEWRERKREVDFVGYNRDHTACLILNEAKARRAINLCLLDRFGIQFRTNPIAPTNAPAVAINRVAVHLPACFSSTHERKAYANTKSPEAQRTLTTRKDEAWKVLSLSKCSLEPRDDKKLLEMWHAAPPQPGPVTIEELRQGRGGVRDKFLQGVWADRYGVNLEEIPVAARVFRTWLAKHAFHPDYPTSDLETVLDPWQWEVLETSARYEIIFDGNFRRCWLDDIRERAITDPLEIEDFDRLEGRLTKSATQQSREKAYLAAKMKIVKAENKLVAQRVSLAKIEAHERKEAARQKKIQPWHKGGFRVLYRLTASGEIRDQHTPSTTLRALCQILYDHPEHRARYGKIESLLGDRIRNLEIEEGRAAAELSFKGKKQLRSILKAEEARKLTNWGVLKVHKSGREKFLILSAPKPVE